MAQTLYVLVYHSRPFAAHWSFWLPHNEGGRELDTGDRIHVTGDRLNGFQYEYVQDYNVREDERNPTPFAIGLVPGAVLGVDTGNSHDTVADGALDGNIIINAFDKACREVQAPGPSLVKVNTMDSNKAAGPPRRTEVRDCQWWITQAVMHLIQADMLWPLDLSQGAETPAARVEQLPRH